MDETERQRIIPEDATNPKKEPWWTTPLLWDSVAGMFVAGYAIVFGVEVVLVVAVRGCVILFH